MKIFFYLIASYLVGSIPTGYWLGKIWKGIDVREFGSGNLGATNVLRVLGKGPGFLTLAIDILKGALAVWGATFVSSSPVLALGAGLAAIMGHTASIFVQFRGGKGVATSAGVFVALLPSAMGIALLTFGVVFALTRIVSLGSIAGALALAIASCFLSPDRMLAGAAVAVAVFVLWTHRSNIQRLLKGTEPRVSLRGAR